VGNLVADFLFCSEFGVVSLDETAKGVVGEKPVSRLSNLVNAAPTNLPGSSQQFCPPQGQSLAGTGIEHFSGHHDLSKSVVAPSHAASIEPFSIPSWPATYEELNSTFSDPFDLGEGYGVSQLPSPIFDFPSFSTTESSTVYSTSPEASTPRQEQLYGFNVQVPAADVSFSVSSLAVEPVSICARSGEFEDETYESCGEVDPLAQEKA